MQVFIVATVTGHRTPVQDKIRELDPGCIIENAGNACSFWVATRLTKFTLEAITGVAQAFLSLVDQSRLHKEQHKNQN